MNEETNTKQTNALLGGIRKVEHHGLCHQRKTGNKKAEMINKRLLEESCKKST